MLKWGEHDYGSLQHSPPNTTRLMTFCRSNIFYLFFLKCILYAYVVIWVAVMMQNIQQEHMFFDFNIYYHVSTSLCMISNYLEECNLFIIVVLMAYQSSMIRQHSKVFDNLLNTKKCT